MSKNFVADKWTLDAVKVAVDSIATNVSNVLRNVDALMTDWTSNRASKIDTIDTNAAQASWNSAELVNAYRSGVLTEKHKKSKHKSFGRDGGALTQTVTINGPGELLYIMLSDVPLTCTMVIDGVTVTQSLGAYAAFGMSWESTDSAPLVGFSTNETYKIIHPICFSKSCVITLKSQNTTNVVARVHWNQYE